MLITRFYRFRFQGTKAEGSIQYLFGGKTKNFVKCLNVEYESSLTETFCGKCQIELVILEEGSP